MGLGEARPGGRNDDCFTQGSDSRSCGPRVRGGFSGLRETERAVLLLGVGVLELEDAELLERLAHARA